jgi:hypothetical protein
MERSIDLDGRWREILDFERSWTARVAKEAAIRRRFGVSAARYYHALNRLLDRPEALRYDAALVRRLRRIRENRRRVRFGGIDAVGRASAW